MRRIRLFIASSLDGFIAGKNGEIDWLFTDQDYGYREFFDSIDTTLTGRKTYDLVKTFEENPYPGKTNYIFSGKANELSDPNAIFIHEEAAAFAKQLKMQDGKDIWLVGGGEINTALAREGLIDELIISVHPVLLGEGIRMFNEHKPAMNLKLVRTIAFPSGLVQLHYVKS